MMQNLLAIQKGLDKIGAYLSPTKLSNFFAGAIFFFASTQLGLHFWPDSSLVYGVRIDYLSPTIYFLDILIVLFLVSDLFLRRLLDRRPEQSSSRDTEGGRCLLTGIIPLLLTNLLYSQNPLSTLSWSLHFFLYLAFLRRLFDRRLLMGTLRLILPLTLLLQALLSLTQVYLGHSIGGPMYYLGERIIAVGAPSIALGSFIDVVVLRAYGTFGHPNVLAGYAVVCLLVLFQISQTATPNAGKQRAVRKSDLLNGIYFPLLLTVLIVFLTQSRSAALALFGIIVPLYLLKNFKSRIIYFSVSLLVCWFVGSSFIDPSRADLSSAERRALQSVSLKVIENFPTFGTGAQSSISTYPSVSPESRLLQPDHNSFTLFPSWFGIFGLLAIFQIIPCTSSTKTREKCLQTLRSLGGLLPLLLLDHYLLTSPQGLFILLLYLFVVNYPHAQKNRQ